MYDLAVAVTRIVNHDWQMLDSLQKLFIPEKTSEYVNSKCLVAMRFADPMSQLNPVSVPIGRILCLYSGLSWLGTKYTSAKARGSGPRT